MDALARLPALQRAVLVLHYMDDLLVAEIGRELGKSEGTSEGRQDLHALADVALEAVGAGFDAA